MNEVSQKIELDSENELSCEIELKVTYELLSGTELKPINEGVHHE